MSNLNYRTEISSPVYYLKAGLELIPLKDLKYDVEIQNSISKVQLTQLYENNFDEPIEAEYYFAISPKQVLYEMRAEIDGEIIVGKVKDKSEAKLEYDEALRKGNTAAFAEIHEESHDFVKVQIGNIRPGKQVKIIFSYLEQLQTVANKFWKFSLGNPFQGSKFSEREKEDGFVNMQVLPQTPYLQSVELDLKSESEIEFVASPSHDGLENLRIQKKHATHYKIYLDKTLPDREFVLLYRDSEINKPQQIYQHSPGFSPDYRYAALVSFLPEFDAQDRDYTGTYRKFKEKFLRNHENFDPDYSKIEGARGEFVFIVDRSGSMERERIKMTREVLQQVLEILPADSYFNIISFGSQFSAMYPNSVKYTESSKKAALEQVSLFEANMGGTEIYEPLQFVFEQENIKNYPKNIFLITDGQVHNNDQIVRLVKQSVDRTNSRLYSLGIGNGVSYHLIQATSEQGRGKYEIIQETSMLEEKLKALVQDAVSPYIDSFRLEFDEKRVSLILPRPETLVSIRKNEPFQFIVFFKDNIQDTQLTLSYFDSSKGRIQRQSIQISREKFQEGNLVHKLGFHKLIRNVIDQALYDVHELEGVYAPDLQDAKTAFQSIKELTIQAQVLSEFSAFILVKQNNLSDKPKDLPLKIVIPVQQSQDYERVDGIVIADTRVNSGPSHKLVSKSKSAPVPRLTSTSAPVPRLTSASEPVPASASNSAPTSESTLTLTSMPLSNQVIPQVFGDSSVGGRIEIDKKRLEQSMDFSGVPKSTQASTRIGFGTQMVFLVLLIFSLFC